MKYGLWSCDFSRGVNERIIANALSERSRSSFDRDRCDFIIL